VVPTSNAGRGDAERRAVLEKTRAQLLSPPPRATRIRKRYRENNDWKVGELISYQTLAGKYAVLRVLGHVTGSTGKHPILELVDWYTATPASREDARNLATRFGIERAKHAYVLSHMTILAATSSRDQPVAQLRRLGLSSAPFERVERCNIYRPWRHFDEYVDKVASARTAGNGSAAVPPWTGAERRLLDHAPFQIPGQRRRRSVSETLYRHRQPV
jgi:hypothetical protein